MDDKGFIVYGDIEEILDDLTIAQVGILFKMMVHYHKTGTIDENAFASDRILKYVFIPIRQQMDRNAEKYRLKCDKNRENAAKRWSTNDEDACERMRTKSSHADTDTDTDTDTKTERDTATESTAVDILSLSSSLIASLNRIAGTKFRPDAAETLKLITALSKKGYTEEQMQRVIEKKCDEWLGDPKMEGYLRPKTLFKPANFENYLNAPETARAKERAKERAKKENQANAGAEVKRMTERLDEVRKEIDSLDVKNHPDHFERRSKLKEEEVILEEGIKRLRRFAYA